MGCPAFRFGAAFEKVEVRHILTWDVVYMGLSYGFIHGGIPTMVGKTPTNPWKSFPTKNDHDLGCEMGVQVLVPPFKETPI